MAKKAARKKLRVRSVLDVPLREVSGICSQRGRNRKMSLVAVGDRVAKVARLSLPYNERKGPEWRLKNIAKLAGSKFPKKNPQIEAVCADGLGHILLLQETPPRLEVIDPDLSKVIASIELTVKGHGELSRSWSDLNGSHGEGMVLLSGGRLLVAKEKHPAALIEFGLLNTKSRGLAQNGALGAGKRWPVRKGSHRFVALAVWYPDKKLAAACADFSDLEIGPDGHLYVLSDKSATIARLHDLPAGGGTASLTAVWKLARVKGKPEGLGFTANGRAVVALDERKASRNLVMFEPPISRQT
jgi:hypothetical protein